MRERHHDDHAELELGAPGKARAGSHILLGILGLLLLTGCGPDRWYADQAREPLVIQNAERDQTEADEAAEHEATALAVEANAPLPTPSYDDDGRLVLRVEDAVLLAVANNRDLRVRRYDPTIAATFEDIERGAYDPELFASAQLERERTSETDRGTGDRFEVDGETTTVEAGLRQALPTGTTVELAASQEAETSDRTPDQQESRVGLTVTQALLRGFGPAVNLAEVRQAALDAEISRYELRGFAEALVAETESAYWRLVLAERRIAILEDSLRVAEQERADTEERIAVGAEARSAGAATRSEVARRQVTLIDARADRSAQALRLLRLVTPHRQLDFDRPVALATDAAISPGELGAQAEHIELAAVKRAELGEARLRLAQRRLETVVTRNGLLPRLDFFVDLGKTGYGESFSDAAGDLDGDTYDLTVGVDFSYRLGDRAAAARDVAAIASRQRARAAIANLEQLVELEVRLAWNEVGRAAEQIAATATAVALQEETLAAERERLAAGASTQLLVAQAQRDLLTAQLAELEAAVDYRAALIELYRAEGSLLERRGIALGGP